MRNTSSAKRAATFSGTSSLTQWTEQDLSQSSWLLHTFCTCPSTPPSDRHPLRHACHRSWYGDKHFSRLGTGAQTCLWFITATLRKIHNITASFEWLEFWGQLYSLFLELFILLNNFDFFPNYYMLNASLSLFLYLPGEKKIYISCKIQPVQTAMAMVCARAISSSKWDCVWS